MSAVRLLQAGILLLLACRGRGKGRRGAYSRDKVWYEREIELEFSGKIPDWGPEWHVNTPSLPGKALAHGSEGWARVGDEGRVESEASFEEENRVGGRRGRHQAKKSHVEKKEKKIEKGEMTGTPALGTMSKCKDYVACSRQFQQEIQALQHPMDCSSPGNRFLFLEFEGLEGVGSTLAMIAEGLAEGIYSNRTTMFLTVMPTMLKQDFLLANPQSEFPCGKGAYSALDCYIEPLTSCKVSNVLKHRKEFKEFTKNIYDDRFRFKAMESRRGSPALHVAPARYRHLDEPHRWWQKEILRYVFRLKKKWVNIFRKKRESLALKPPVIGLHIRHGDLSLKFEFGDKKGQRAYQNRPYYPAEFYFDELRARIASGDLPRPRTIYVATDGIQVETAVEQERQHPFWSNPRDSQENPGNPGESPPGDPVEFVLLNRFRSQHGAHTAATLLALPYSAAKELAETPEEERARNFANMVQDAIEDIWMLSTCDAFLGTGSSHFTAFANNLRERKDKGPGNWGHYMDAEGLKSGLYCPGLFHGTINGTSRILFPEKRHQILQQRFLDRLVVPQDFLKGNMFEFDARRSFYHIPTHMFDHESVRWRDRSKSRVNEWETTPQAIQKDPNQLLKRIVGLINNGAEMDTYWSYAMAYAGWCHAKDLLEKVWDGKLEIQASDDLMDQLEDVITGNIAVHKSRHASPYIKLLKDPKARTYHNGNKPSA
ncbi:hypothetical protein AAMO2058_000223500 [Amorphochlora amoebiformis]